MDSQAGLPRWQSCDYATHVDVMPSRTVRADAPPWSELGRGEDHALANLLMSWYYSGYYTGRFRAIQELRGTRSIHLRNTDGMTTFDRSTFSPAATTPSATTWRGTKPSPAVASPVAEDWVQVQVQGKCVGDELSVYWWDRVSGRTQWHTPQRTRMGKMKI
jgi:hypothetical protein